MLQMLKESLETQNFDIIKNTQDISYTDCSLNLEGPVAKMHASMNASIYVDRVRISLYLKRKQGDDWVLEGHWSQDFIGKYGSMRKNHIIDETQEYRLMTYYYAYKANDSNFVEMVINNNCNQNS